MAKSIRPFVVDLDGTLLKADSTILYMEKALKRLDLPLLSLMLKGKDWVKAYLTYKYPLDLGQLPWRDSIMGHIRDFQSAGRPVWLATASHKILARQVCNYFQLDGYIGSDSRKCLKGGAKAEYLVSKFGKKGFDYAGDSKSDLPVWQYAAVAYIPRDFAWRNGLRQDESGIVYYE